MEFHELRCEVANAEGANLYFGSFPKQIGEALPSKIMQVLYGDFLFAAFGQVASSKASASKQQAARWPSGCILRGSAGAQYRFEPPGVSQQTQTEATKPEAPRFKAIL